MLSKRLQAVAKFIDKKDNLIDVGCDHGYLGIYLKTNNLVNTILLTDVNKNALSNAISNIKNFNLNIPTILTNGLEDVATNQYDTISISGMGTSTIKKILNPTKLSTISKIIIQSKSLLTNYIIFSYIFMWSLLTGGNMAAKNNSNANKKKKGSILPLIVVLILGFLAYKANPEYWQQGRLFQDLKNGGQKLPS